MTDAYILTAQAKQDLADIADVIAEQSGLAPAERVVRELQQNFQLLAQQPDVGHGRDDITDDRAVRFWSVYSYLIVFSPAARPLAVVRILHGSRDPQELRKHLREAQTGDE